MKTYNINLYLVFIIIGLLIFGWIAKQEYDKKLEKAYKENRTLKISKDELVKVNDEQYRKLVGDTLTQRQLNKIVDSLKLKLDAKPTTIIETVFVPVNDSGEIDDVIVLNDSITIEDYYPNKENYFVKYFAKIAISTEDGIGEFSFSPIKLNLIISQKEDGIYQLDTKTPNWLLINNINIQSIPLTPTKIDNFGWIVGGGYGKDYNTFENYLKLSAGFRWKKFYLLGNVSTNNNIDIGVNLEL